MDENKLKFGVGVLVIASIGVGIILTFLFGAFPSVLNDDYSLSVVFPSAEGIGPNTAVYRDGVPIGRVASIQLRDEGGVLVTLAMKSDQVLSHYYVPSIGSGNFVTGDANLEFVRADARQLPANIRADEELMKAPFTDGEFIPYGKKTPSLFEMQSGIQTSVDAIQQAAQSIAGAGDSVNQLAMEVRGVVGGTDDRINEISLEAQKAIQLFQEAIKDVRAIIGDEDNQQNLEKAIARLPVLLQDAQSTLDSTQRTFDRFERVGDQFEKVGVAAEDAVNTAKVTVQGAQRTINNAEKTFATAERTLANIEQFTQPLADRGEELVEEVCQTLNSLDRALNEVADFGQSLNNSNGTVKRLLDDDELYFQLRRTIENIELATARIRPILDDVRVFSDKIARDPRELGVRGALTKRPSGSGLK